jgi:hypothetical protein
VDGPLVRRTLFAIPMALRLYTDPSLLPAGVLHVPMLVPFLGRVDPPESPEYHRFDRYMEVGRGFLDFTSLAGADVAVLPFGWEAVIADDRMLAVALRFADRVRAAGKRLVVFCESDSAAPIPLPDAIVFRTSLYGSRRTAREFALPGWTGDPVEQYFGGQLPLRSRGERPVVGFQGYAPRRSRSVARDLLIGVRQAIGQDAGEPRALRTRRRHAVARHAALERIASSCEVDAAIVRNPSFAGGSHGKDGSVDWAQMKEARLSFVQHMASSDYALAVRGAGNFSYRFYEALSCGRVPVFVNTDCVLPYENVIDWHGQCIWVDVEALDSIGPVVRGFHDALTDDDFRDRQRAARVCWEQWLSPEAFFANIHRALDYA